MYHTLKITPAHFDAVASGQKTLEIRREDDKTFAVGDVLTLQELKKNICASKCAKLSTMMNPCPATVMNTPTNRYAKIVLR